ncbi:Galactose-specific lectin nattectin [Channa argus]|uniref:Galactose-specific lectin nattectin n=1 Tax=Channa argus TaxID=215402 RepID=A0A6G1QGC3_CHAAH|nr:Galactose-specific lectin nattectin [Channa argus]
MMNSISPDTLTWLTFWTQMASGLHLIVVLCVTIGLWFAENAECHSDGWSRFDNRLYRFYNSPMEWSDAERFCTNFDANLATIQTPDIYNFIRGLVVRATGTNAETWVGGTDASKEGVWLWSSGARFTFNRWGPGEPNNLGGRENCMHINLRGQDFVNDANCDLRMPFVCVKRRMNL